MEFNDFKTVCLYQTRYTSILTQNIREDLSDLQIVHETKFALNHDKCQELLNLKAAEIECLKLVGDFEHKLTVEENIFDLNFRIFTNLKQIIFFETVLSNDDLLAISQNCYHLNSVHVIKCFCPHFDALLPGINWNLQHFQQMPRLQELKIEPQKPPGIERFLKLNQLQQLLGNHMKLHRLLLQNFTIDCDEDENNDSANIPDNLWNLEILNIGIITKKFWCTFTDYLKFCRHLRELTIHLNDCGIIISVKIIDILSKYCKNLSVLHLENCQINLENFCLLQGLAELTLNSCSGLTFANLQQILGGLHLQKFCLINTHVIGVCNHIYIVKTLESITIDTMRFTEISEIFQKSLNNFDYLLKLNWLKGYINHTWIMEKCPSLEYLQIPSPYFLGRIVKTMKHLKELTINSCNGLTWALLFNAIRNLKLRRLHLLTNNFIIDDKCIEPKSFKENTTLELITMPYQMFLLALRHWLDLLEVNEQLGLVIFGKAKEILSARLLFLLLKEECIQKRCDNIKICGFSLDLEDFQQNTITREFVKLHINTNHYRTQNLPFTLELKPPTLIEY